MNYGYDKQVKGWKEEKKAELAYELSALCHEYPDAYNMYPYVETYGLYDGVRIRRITHLEEEKRRELVKRADTIYLKVMGIKETTTKKE